VAPAIASVHPDELAISRPGQWDAEVAKMIKAFGARSTGGRQEIGDYLRRIMGIESRRPGVWTNDGFSTGAL